MWRRDYAIGGVDSIALHHCYRAMAFLGEVLSDQADATPFSPRCMKDLVEEKLFGQHRHLFTGLDLVFFDTTSIYFEGEGGATLGQFGHSKDHRSDRKQMVVGAILDDNGRPICCEMWPGNTADVKSLLPVVERLRKRFGIKRFCIVADRGMISADTIATLETPECNIPYILGARMRRVKEVSQEVLSRGGRYHEVHPEGVSSKSPAPLAVKEVLVEGRRYIVCRNSKQERKDAAAREAMIAALEERIKTNPKGLVGNRGYARYIKVDKGGMTIDREKIDEEARFDGKWVLRTNMKLSAEQVALKYKELWQVEQVFRDVKSILDTRPVFHKRDETIRGHVFCSFLALLSRHCDLQGDVTQKAPGGKTDSHAGDDDREGKSWAWRVGGLAGKSCKIGMEQLRWNSKVEQLRPESPFFRPTATSSYLSPHPTGNCALATAPACKPALPDGSANAVGRHQTVSDCGVRKNYIHENQLAPSLSIARFERQVRAPAPGGDCDRGDCVYPGAGSSAHRGPQHGADLWRRRL